MTKRLLSVLLAALLLVGGLTACGADKKKPNPPATTANKSTTTTTSAFPVYYVTATTLNVRSAPAIEEQNVIGKLSYGTPVEILETVDGWYRITFNGVPGYISADYVSQTPVSTLPPTTATTLAPHTVLYLTADKVNMRKEPINGDVLCRLAYGSVVELVATEENWYCVKFEGQTGYIRSDFLSVTPPSGVTAVPTTTTATKAPTGTYPDASIPPLKGGLTEDQRTELYEGLQDIIATKGSDYQSIYTYVNKNKTYVNKAEGESIEQMAYYMLTHKSASCYYFAAFTYLLMKEAGYEVDFVRGLGWQNGTEHCWIMFKDTDGWYFMDSLYVRSAKLTTKRCKEIGYKWNPNVHPEAK